MSYDSAKAFIQTQGVRTRREFYQWVRSGQRPENFPSTPSQAYKKDWISWGDFLGTGNIAAQKVEWMSFSQAKAFIQTQDIQSAAGFNAWKKKGLKPANFPSRPEKIYKENWTSWGDFLGTENLSTRGREWMSYGEAKTYIQAQGIKTHEEFDQWTRSGQRPENFPSNPNRTYEEDWTSWGDFLGTGNLSTREKQWMNFEEAQTFIRKQNFKNAKEFRRWASSDLKPENFPSHPERTYKESWISWGDFLGTGNIFTREKQWMKYSAAKRYVQSLGIDNLRDFIEWLRSDRRPENFPPQPHQVYKEWTSAADFLSSVEKDEEYMPYQEAKIFISSMRLKTIRDFFEMRKFESDVFPENFPSNPQVVYKKSGEWKGWDDFLDTASAEQNTNSSLFEEQDLEENFMDDEDAVNF